MPDYIVKQLATVAVLHNHVELFFRFNDFVQLNHVGVAHLLKNFDFTSYALNVFLVMDLVLLENLDCDLLAGKGVLAELALPKSSFAEMLACRG